MHVYADAAGRPASFIWDGEQRVEGLSQDVRGPLWYMRPLAQREAAAAPYDDLPITLLRLPLRVERSLRQSDSYGTIGGVMRAGPAIRYLRNVGAVSLRQMDDALRPYFSPPPLTTARGAAYPPLAVSVATLATLPPFEMVPWYMLPPNDRRATAEAFGSAHVDLLELSVADRGRLGVYGPLTLGQLIGSAPPIADSVAPGTLRRVHDRIRTFARTVTDALEHIDAVRASLDGLARRPELADLTVERLAWPVVLTRALAEVGISTLGELAATDALTMVMATAPETHRTGDLASRLTAVLELPESVGPTDLARLWAAEGVSTRPQGFGAPNGMSLRDGVHATLREWTVPDDTAWAVLQHRYGLLGARTLTLRELGEAFGVTRERVRQIQVRAMKHVAVALDQRETPVGGARLHPAVSAAFDALDETIGSVSVQPMSDAVFVARCNHAIGVEGPELDGAARLLADLGGLRRLRLKASTTPTVWHKLPDPEANRLALQVGAVHHHFARETTDSCTLVDVVRGANRHLPEQERLTVATAREVLPLCGGIDLLPDGRYRAQIEALDSRTDQVARILADSGKPMHLSEIARDLNRHLAPSGQRSVREEILAKQMVQDSRFVPIGRSGHWALSAWVQVETDSVLALMERCLVEHDRPMTPDEIHAWVSERRPVRSGSVAFYLTGCSRFARIGTSGYGLATWRESRDAQAWDPKGVASFVAEMFKCAGTDRLPFPVIRDALATAAAVNKRRSAGLLTSNPAIRTEVTPDGVHHAILRRDYRKRLANSAKRPIRSNTLQRQMADRAYVIVAQTPGGEVRLVELRKMLLAEYGSPAATVYAYLHKANGIEAFESDDRPGKWVRVRAPARDA